MLAVFGITLAALSAVAAGQASPTLRATAILEGELREAMSQALGCGGHVGEEHLAALEQVLSPLWRVLPKTSTGRLDSRSLRHLVHRHFSGRSGLHLRGFEPSRSANVSAWGDVEVLNALVPGYVESVLQHAHKLERGFDLRDAAIMVATLEQLIFDSESALLEHAYELQGQRTDSSLDADGFLQVLDYYMIHWLAGEDKESLEIFLNHRDVIEREFQQWAWLSGFVKGQIRALEYKRKSAPVASILDGSSRTNHNAMHSQFSFEDAHRVVGDITKSFSSFWETECDAMKQSLVALDTHTTGRVPLSEFYNLAAGSDDRFGESEAYLAELGVLDNSSTWNEPQIIIPNYIQAKSNCVVTTKHYSVCCVSDCESHLSEIEEAVGASSAEPAKIVNIVSQMSSHRLLDDAAPVLDASLKKQLQDVAELHGGRVPLHGRLFAQWLHFVFPRECAFPHKAGDVSLHSPFEFERKFGDFMISEMEKQKLVASANTSELPAFASKEDFEWMAQLSMDEELVATHDLAAPWRSRNCMSLVGFAVAMLVLPALLALFVSSKEKRPNFDFYYNWPERPGKQSSTAAAAVAEKALIDSAVPIFSMDDDDASPVHPKHVEGKGSLGDDKHFDLAGEEEKLIQGDAGNADLDGLASWYEE